jgi:hypothetical protein
MSDITTIEQERDDLGLHVDLCAQRYLQLEKRLEIVEVKVDRLIETITKNNKQTTTMIITSVTTLLAGIAGLITTILLKF